MDAATLGWCCSCDGVVAEVEVQLVRGGAGGAVQCGSRDWDGMVVEAVVW